MRTLKWFPYAGFFCLAFLLLSGCRGKDGLSSVGGVVSYAGTPVEKGIIRFLPANDDGPTAAGEVVDGRYACKVAIGKKRVQIEAYRVVGRKHHANDPNAPMVDIQEQTLPERFNVKTELTCEITADSRVQDFALKK